MLPNFLGIGAPKAATTWIFQCLREHPEVFVARQKEVNVLHYNSWSGDLSVYEQHFAAAGAARAVGEISVRYLDSPNAPQRVARYLPGARVFVSLRNPIEQTYSHYWHLKRQNFHQSGDTRLPASFEEAIERFPQLLLEPARYGQHLSRWLEHVERSRLLVLFYEDIQAAPLAELQRLFHFLGVDHTFVPPSLRVRGAATREGTSPRGELAAAAHRVLYATLARGVYQPMKRLLGVRRAARIKDALHVRELMELVLQKKGYPAMSPQARRQLGELFRHDIAVVSALTGRDLSAWS